MGIKCQAEMQQNTSNSTIAKGEMIARYFYSFVIVRSRSGVVFLFYRKLRYFLLQANLFFQRHYRVRLTYLSFFFFFDDLACLLNCRQSDSQY